MNGKDTMRKREETEDNTTENARSHSGKKYKIEMKVGNRKGVTLKNGGDKNEERGEERRRGLVERISVIDGLLKKNIVEGK